MLFRSNCIDIPTGGGGGPSGVQMSTVEKRAQWVFPFGGDDLSNQLTISCDNSNQRITGLFVDVVESPDGHSPINMQGVAFSVVKLTGIHQVDLVLLHLGPVSNPNNPTPEPVTVDAVALCTSVSLVP